MTTKRIQLKRTAVNKLARELYGIGAARGRSRGNTPSTWRGMSSNGRACHRAIAEYVLKNFVRNANQ